MKNKLLLILLTLILLLSASCMPAEYDVPVTLADIPQFSGFPYVVINENTPYFTPDEITDESFEYYSPLDVLGRCGACISSVSKDTFPTDERESISEIKPSGWRSVKYEHVEGFNLYNRCHLIGFQLTGENANENNLITGTSYLNREGMLAFENAVADYIKQTDNHVMYRVTPIFEGANLLASGVLMEAYSVEDNGFGLSFCVYCYNVEPGVIIDYSDGTSKLDPSVFVSIEPTEAPTDYSYVLNTNTKKIHYPWCASVNETKSKYKEYTILSVIELKMQGYKACNRCDPK